MSEQEAHTFDLLDRSREPFPRTQHPEGHGVNDHDAYSDYSVVERLRVYRVCLGKDEDDGDEENPDACDEGDRVGEGPEMERAALEALAVDESECDGDTCGE